MSCDVLGVRAGTGVHFRVLAGAMAEPLLEPVKKAEHQQSECRTHQGDGYLAESGSGARCCGHPDAGRGREAMYFPLSVELENRAATQEADSGCEPLHDP